MAIIVARTGRARTTANWGSQAGARREVRSAVARAAYRKGRTYCCLAGEEVDVREERLAIIQWREERLVDVWIGEGGGEEGED